MSTALISNPPYNMKWKRPPFAQMQPRFIDCELPPESNANYAFILTALDMVDRAVFLLPCGILTTDNKREKEIRKYLVDKNYIEAVITCPDNMFEATTIPTCIIILNRKKKTTCITLVDARKIYTVEERLQNGQYGGVAHEGRTYKKQIKTFSDADMDKILRAIREKENTPEFSRLVSLQDVAAGEYILSPARYIESMGQKNKHRPYEDILDDLNRTIAGKNILKLTINETMAKSLGLYDFGILQKESQMNGEQISANMEKLFGKKIIKDNYISLTKNKGEIKFENTSKDKMSQIFVLILQMYREHIIYLNDEENRYMIELREALLPDIMSGKIELMLD